MSTDEFEALYGEYTFESIFEGQGELELCPEGKKKKLTKENADDYIKLWLEKYTQLESAQFS